MTKRPVTRRQVLAALGTGATASFAGCSAVGNLLGPSKFQKQLQTIKDAVEPYKESPQTAIKDGYTNILGPFIPGMGWHFSNPDYTADAIKNGFSLEKPQILTYDANGKLGSVEFGAPAPKVPKNPDLFADQNADATEQWQIHKAATHVYSDGDETVTADPSKIPPEKLMTIDHWVEFHPPNPDLKPGDTYKTNEWGLSKTTEERVVDFTITHPDLNSLHVWLVDNPEGVFNPLNPNFAQP